MLSPFFLCTRHHPAVLLVIHSEQVQQTMKHQDLNFFRKAVSEISSLRSGTLGGNRNLARESTRCA